MLKIPRDMMTSLKTVATDFGRQVETAAGYSVSESRDIAEKTIGLTDCSSCGHSPVITVRKRGAASYSYIARRARVITRWITVTADSFRHAVERKVRAFVQQAVILTGVQILRQSAILRF